MCTVTVLPEAALTASRAGTDASLRLRVACNRDELLTRAPALPPVTRRIGDRLAIMPVDPDSGGTWIGANDAGLVCALLNLYAAPRQRVGPRSRGTVIPLLLGCGSVNTALTRVLELPTDQYSPFRLLLLDGRNLIECWNQEDAIHRRRESLQKPLLRTSSGLGDDLVIGPRSALFQEFLAVASDPIAAVDLFHLHQWRGRQELSVLMRRRDARTVSHTVVEIREGMARLVYRPAEAPDSVSVSVAAA